LCSGRLEIYIEVNWPERDYGIVLYLYIHVNITVYKMCWLDLVTFNVHVLRASSTYEECKIILTENDSRPMSSSQFPANKNQQKILGKKNPRSRKRNNPSVPSITPLFNLLALHNKLNLKSFLMLCVWVFFSSFFYIIV